VLQETKRPATAVVGGIAVFSLPAPAVARRFVNAILTYFRPLYLAVGLAINNAISNACS